MANLTDQFNEVIDKIEKDDIGKFDFMMNLQDIKIDTTDDESRKFILKSSEDNSVEESYGTTNNAYGQIMNRFSIPAGYAIKVPGILLEPHFEWWKSKIKESNPEKKVFVRAKRTEDGDLKVRAILSDRYSALDNRHVVEEFKKALEEVNYTVKDFHITEDMFNARILLNDYCVDGGIGPDGKPNKFFAGLHIINGETGNFPASLELIIYEQWCTNGCVRRFDSKAVFARRHIGVPNLIEEFSKAITTSLEKATESIEMLLATKSQTIEDPMLKLSDIMDRDRKLFSEDVKPRVIEAFESRPEPNKYGIISAITQAAQAYGYEKRLEMERFAGKLMSARI